MACARVCVTYDHSHNLVGGVNALYVLGYNVYSPNSNFPLGLTLPVFYDIFLQDLAEKCLISDKYRSK